MTTMTQNGVSTTTAFGQEQYESWYNPILKRDLIQYDYRHTDGELFSIVKPTLEACREARDKWLTKKMIETGI